jgi:hypothetical protein
MEKVPVNIAVVLPLSGDEERFGSQELHSVQMPVARNIASGGCHSYIFSDPLITDHNIKLLFPYLVQNKGKSFCLAGADCVWLIKISEAIRNAVSQLGGRVTAEDCLASKSGT